METTRQIGTGRLRVVDGLASTSTNSPNLSRDRCMGLSCGWQAARHLIGFAEFLIESADIGRRCSDMVRVAASHLPLLAVCVGQPGVTRLEPLASSNCSRCRSVTSLKSVFPPPRTIGCTSSGSSSTAPPKRVTKAVHAELDALASWLGPEAVNLPDERSSRRFLRHREVQRGLESRIAPSAAMSGTHSTHHAETATKRS